MKGLLKSFLISLASLYATTLLIAGFKYEGGIKTLLTGACAFTVINWFVKPIVKIFMLPFNLITLGIFSWLVNVFMLYLLIRIVPQIQISIWNFSGFHFQGFNIPSINFSVFLTYILVSFIIALISNLLNWLSN